MGIRETINAHPKIATTVVACAAIAGVVVIGIELRGDDGKPPSKNFFSADDGKTWFADSAGKLPPYDYDGGKAVRAYLFKGPSGKFVGLLEKYNEATRTLLSGDKKPDLKTMGELPVLVKKPGESAWKSMDATAEARALMEIAGPEGSNIERIMP